MRVGDAAHTADRLSRNAAVERSDCPSSSHSGSHPRPGLARMIQGARATKEAR